MTRPYDYWASGAGLGHITPPGNRWPEGEKFKIFYPDIFFGQDVVEFGCGTGRLAPFFGKKRYHGVDICSKAIMQARAENNGYVFDLIDSKSPIEGGHVLFAHCVMMHIPDEELSTTIGRFTQRRIIVSEILGKNWRREGNPPVFNREIHDYDAAFVENGYALKRVQFKPSDHYPGTDFAILEAHKVFR